MLKRGPGPNERTSVEILMTCDWRPGSKHEQDWFAFYVGEKLLFSGYPESFVPAQIEFLAICLEANLENMTQVAKNSVSKLIGQNPA